MTAEERLQDIKAAAQEMHGNYWVLAYKTALETEVRTLHARIADLVRACEEALDIGTLPVGYRFLSRDDPSLPHDVLDSLKEALKPFREE